MSRFSCTIGSLGWVLSVSLTEPYFWLNSFQLLILLLLLLLCFVHNMLRATTCMWTLKDSFPKSVLFLHRGSRDRTQIVCLVGQTLSPAEPSFQPLMVFLQFYFIEVINANCMLRHLPFWSGVCFRDWSGRMLGSFTYKVALQCINRTLCIGFIVGC